MRREPNAFSGGGRRTVPPSDVSSSPRPRAMLPHTPLPNGVRDVYPDDVGSPSAPGLPAERFLLPTLLLYRESASNAKGNLGICAKFVRSGNRVSVGYGSCTGVINGKPGVIGSETSPSLSPPRPHPAWVGAQSDVRSLGRRGRRRVMGHGVCAVTIPQLVRIRSRSTPSTTPSPLMSPIWMPSLTSSAVQVGPS